MTSGLFTEQRTTAVPAGLLVVARIANMALGLAVIPILIHYLGGEGFAAWAILLAIGAVFALLEVGMAPTYVKHAAPLIQREDWQQVGAVLQQVLTILILVFAVGALPVFWFADAWAHRLNLPDSGLLAPGRQIELVYGAIALRATLQLGPLTLNAARRFKALAAASFLQSFLSNVAAAGTVIATRRLDATLLVFWAVQLAVLAVIFVVACRRYVRVGALVPPRVRVLAGFVTHGLKIQIYDWAQVVSYQFDKFLIAVFMGLWAVAPYEVGNRSVLALRSVPSSGLESFLATAAISQQNAPELWRRYQEMTQLAAIAVLVFMIAPLAIAPAFLYAWTGEMGYVGRWVFFSLILGAACNVLTLPTASMAQAMGRADLQARSAIATLLLNIPLSFILVLKWELAGVAAGTAVAMLAGSLLLLVEVHRVYRQPLSATLRGLARLWPALLVCLGYALLVWLPFEAWLPGVDRSLRYARETRLLPGLLAGLAYLACVVSMAMMQIHRGQLTDEQYSYLVRFVRLPRFATYCTRRQRSSK